MYQTYMTHEKGKIHQQRIQAAKEIIEREKSTTTPSDPKSNHQNTNRPQRALPALSQKKNNKMAIIGRTLFNKALESNSAQSKTIKLTF